MPWWAHKLNSLNFSHLQFEFVGGFFLTPDLTPDLIIIQQI
jgi:hypothetical protein